MPFIMDNKIYPTVWHGGMKDLDKIDRINIELKITFPYNSVSDDGTYVLVPVTVNLMTDLKVSASNQVYAVKWGDNTPQLDTVSQADNPGKHSHTYDGGVNSNSRTITYMVEIYGYNLTHYWGASKDVNSSSQNGYSISAREVSLYVRERSNSNRR